MLYNAFDTKFSKLVKLSIFWLSISAMTAFFIFVFSGEDKPQSRNITIELDIKDKVNICTPENSEH